MSVRARVIVEGAFAGLHHNPHAGASIEFAEHKEYAPGDDMRHIDWKAFGRVDRYYIKRFEDETELRTFLLVDASASMGYGRKGRDEAGLRELPGGRAGLPAGAAGRSGRAVLFDEKTRQYLPPARAEGQIRDLLRGAGGCLPRRGARAGPRAGRMSASWRIANLFVLFFGPARRAAPTGRRLRQLRSRGDDVALFHDA